MLIRFAIACSAMAALGAQDNSAPIKKAENRFPILAWIGVPPAETTVERYRELAEAGFTQNMSLDPRYANMAEMDKAVDAARQVGIKQWICVPELDSDPEAVAKHYQGNPDVIGYFINDEPNADKFAALGAKVKRIKAIDPDHLCYVNILGMFDGGGVGCKNYREYLDLFAEQVGVGYLSFDIYPVDGVNVNELFFRCLDEVAAKVKQIDQPMWTFIMSTNHERGHVAQLPGLRLQAFTSLAYGSQCIQYFTYWTPFYEGHLDAPITKDGKRTWIYDAAKTLNGEIQGMSDVFLGAKLANAGYLGWQPTLGNVMKKFEASAPLAAIDSEGIGGVATRLVNGSSEYLVVVNRDLQKALPLTVSLDGSKKAMKVDKSGKITAVAGNEVKASIDPGDIFLLTWK